MVNLCSESFLVTARWLSGEPPGHVGLPLLLSGPVCVAHTLTTAIRILRDGDMRLLSETFSVNFGNELIFCWIAELGEYKLGSVGCQLGTAKREPA